MILIWTAHWCGAGYYSILYWCQVKDKTNNKQWDWDRLPGEITWIMWTVVLKLNLNTLQFRSPVNLLSRLSISYHPVCSLLSVTDFLIPNTLTWRYRHCTAESVATPHYLLFSLQNYFSCYDFSLYSGQSQARLTWFLSVGFGRAETRDCTCRVHLPLLPSYWRCQRSTREGRQCQSGKVVFTSPACSFRKYFYLAAKFYKKSP